MHENFKWIRFLSFLDQVVELIELRILIPISLKIYLPTYNSILGVGSR